ncbi:MAG: substrate-binding domain-containing protein [Synergistaceae bacterium]|jgi:ribose transport system substrate-binding protein|nr:substrate-binding domain-containing protein [Synergistaceae bacterium]
MRKFTAILAAVLVIVCVFAAAAPAGAKEIKQGLKVASINATNTHGWRFVYDKQMREVAEGLKAKGIIAEFTELCPNMDQAVEAQMFETCVNEKYDVILLNAVGSSGLDTQIEMAIDAGITVIFVDNLYPYEGVLGIQTDQRIWAGNACQALVDFLGGKGKIIMLNGILGATGSSVRYDTWEGILANYPDIEVVFKGAHSWSQVESKRVMSEFLASGTAYDAILTEEGCVGILEAIEEAKAPYPKYMTSDEEVGYLRMLARINKDEPVIGFYIIENPPGIGATALKLAVRVASGWEFKDGVLENGSYLYKPSYVVTPDTLAKAVEDTKDMADTDQVSAFITDETADAAFE